MKSIALFLLVVLSTASCLTLHPLFVKKTFQDQVIKTNLGAFIQKAQNLTLLPQKNSFYLKSYKLVDVTTSNNVSHTLSFRLTLDDEVNTIYQGTLKVVYNESTKNSTLESAEISSWNATLSANERLPLFVEIRTPFQPQLYKGRNIAKEIHDQAILKTLAEKVKKETDLISQNLMKHYNVIQIPNTPRFEVLKFDYSMKHDPSTGNWSYVDPKTSAKVLINITGMDTSRRLSHSYSLSFLVSDLNNTKSPYYIQTLKVIPQTKSQGCTILKEESVSNAIKSLQKLNLLPTSSLTTKDVSCEATVTTEDVSYFSSWKYDLKVVLEGSDKTKYEIEYEGEFEKKTGLWVPVARFVDFLEIAPSAQQIRA